MARTLIGRLILQLQAQGLGEARRVTSAMADIENRARQIGAASRAFNWGASFQRNIERLKLTGEEMRAVQRSWASLHESMRSRNLSEALRGAEISTWKNQTIQHFSSVRAAYNTELSRMEARSRRYANSINNILKPAFVGLGFYTAFYGAGMMGREALSASSERRREIFRQTMAGIPETDQESLFNQSEGLSQQYPSVPITAIMEMSRAAYTFMGDAERASAILEAMTKALVVSQSVGGPDAAANLLRQFIRGLDNIGVNESGQKGIDQVLALIDEALKATQIDPDYNIADMFTFAQKAKIAGPAFSMGFLARAPVYMQDQGAPTSGNALAMGFRAFVLEAVGTAGGKRYLEERDRLGIRVDGELVDKLMFGSDPDEWVLKHLVPALQRDGVDLDDNTAVAAAVGKLTGNTTASGFMTKVITQRDQNERWLRNQQNAMGIDAADRVRHEDPFVGWAAFKKALENLSAALVPIDHINSALNSLADGINRLAAVAKDDPAMTALTMGAAGWGAYAGGRWAVNRLADPFGLRTSAVALDGSAAALTRAAAALGGSAAVPGGAGPGGPGKTPAHTPRGSLITALAVAVGAYQARDEFSRVMQDAMGLGEEFKIPFPGEVSNFAFGGIFQALKELAERQVAEPASIEQMRAEQEAWRAREEADKQAHDEWNSPDRTSTFSQWFWGKANDPDFSFREDFRKHFGLDRSAPSAPPVPISPPAGAEVPTADDVPDRRPPAGVAVPTMDDGPLLDQAREAASEVEALMHVQGKADFDTSAIDQGIQKLQQFLRLLREAGSAQQSLRSNVGVEMRRTFSDATP